MVSDLREDTMQSVAIVALGRSRAEYLTSRIEMNMPAPDEVWAINGMAQLIKHDRVFMMDDFEVTLGPEYDWAKTHDKIIYTVKEYECCPKAVAYPLEKVVNSINFAYFNSTVAYAVAYALYKGVKEIRLYGADFTYENQHLAEKGRGCVEFLLAIAHTRNIKLSLPPTTTLIDCNVPKERFYGYLDPVPEISVENDSYKVTMKENPNYTYPFYGYKELEKCAQKQSQLASIPPTETA